MIILKFTLRSLMRRKLRSLAVLAVPLLIVVFISMYATAIDKHRHTLDELHANIEVIGYISDPKGNITGLQIDEKLAAMLEETGFIRSSAYTRKVSVIMGELIDADNTHLSMEIINSPSLVSTNSVAGLPLPPEFMDGYDDTLFTSKEEVCIVSDKFLNNSGYSLGDYLHLTAINRVYNPTTHAYDIYHTPVTLRIVGIYSPRVGFSPIYCPWDVGTRICEETNLPLTIDSAKFILQNTQELNRFRDLLMGLGFVNQQTSSGNSGSGGLSFVIRDRILKKATASVQGYIDFSNALFPVIFLLCAGIGFVVSYLLIRIRKPEFAVMRSLGTSRAITFTLFFLEQGALCITGTLLGVIVSLAMVGAISFLQILTIIGFTVFYLVGAGLAVMTMNQVNVIKILTARE